MFTIGILTQSTNDSFRGQVLSGILQRVCLQGHRAIIVEGAPADLGSQCIASHAVDGWLSILEYEGLEPLLANGKPVMTICHQAPDVPAIMLDNSAIFRTLTEHLIMLGHRKIGFVGWFEDLEPKERFQGYQEALAAHGIPFEPAFVFPASHSYIPGGQTAAEAMISAGMPCTAVVVATDYNAIGMIQRLEQAGYRCPQDIAVVGFDDVPEAQTFQPPLTTARSSFVALGRVAADHLLDWLGGTPPAHTVLIPATLVIRESCGSTPEQSRFAQPLVPAIARHQLAHYLVEQLLAPSRLPAATSPATFWPHVQVLCDTLTAAIDRMPQPSASQIQAAWSEAIVLSRYGDVHSRLLDQMETIAAGWIDPLDRDGQQRISAAIQRLRTELISIGIVLDIDSRHEQYAVFTTIRSLFHFHESTSHLNWLRDTPINLAHLALWDDSSQQALITPSALFVSTGEAPVIPPVPIPIDQFPPAVFLEEAQQRQEPIIICQQVRSPVRNWGWFTYALAYVPARGYDERLTYWHTILANRLDDLALREQLARQQADLQIALDRERSLSETVRELGSPIIPLGNGTLLLPLIGIIDSMRAQQIIDTTLQIVGSQPTRRVLIDVTGVPIIDTHVAGVLLQLTQMVQLLGAESGIVGVRPEIAQSIVSLGVDLSGIRAYASLATALGER